MKITLQFSKTTLPIILNDSKTAKEFLENLPLDSVINTWGDEIYFDVPQLNQIGSVTADVEVGDVAYWVQGSCLAVFFGPTPMSSGKKPVPADEVALLGTVEGDLSPLKLVKSGQKVSVSRGE